MRLLAVNSTRIWGGAEVFFQTFCTAMTDRGHDVTLVTGPGKPATCRSASRFGPAVPIIAVQ